MTDTNKQALVAIDKALSPPDGIIYADVKHVWFYRCLKEHIPTFKAALQPKPSVDVGWLDKLELDLYDDGISADNAQKLIDTVRQGHLNQGWRDGFKYKIGDRLTKTKGSNWTGNVVGFYSTKLTPIGYAVESETEKGSVQIYPEKALQPRSEDE